MDDHKSPRILNIPMSWAYMHMHKVCYHDMFTVPIMERMFNESVKPSERMKDYLLIAFFVPLFPLAPPESCPGCRECVRACVCVCQRGG